MSDDDAEQSELAKIVMLREHLEAELAGWNELCNEIDRWSDRVVAWQKEALALKDAVMRKHDRIEHMLQRLSVLIKVEDGRFRIVDDDADWWKNGDGQDDDASDSG